MTGKTSSLTEEIRRKVISKITAVIAYYNQLKRDKIL